MAVGVLDYLKLVSPILDAVAWPAAIAASIYWFRDPISQILRSLPSAINRIQNLKIANIEAELSQQSEAASLKSDIEKGVTVEQIEAAVRVKADATDVGLNAIEAQAARLAQEYDTTRSLLKGGAKRTLRMNQIMAKMRTIALAAEPLLSQFANNSESAGVRLVAIAILQMKPRRQWLEWLADRMGTEHPFVFYHAAVALQRAVEHLEIDRADELRTAIERATGTVRAFRGGEPDENTLMVLKLASDELAELEGKKHH